MTVYTLDGRKMTSRREAHEYIAEVMQFPDYYGHNFDALADVLGDMGMDFCILLTHKEELLQNMGHWAEVLIRILNNSAEECGFTVLYA